MRAFNTLAAIRTVLDSAIDAAAAKPTVAESAQAIRAMSADKRDDTELGDMPGGASAYNLFEAQELLPRDCAKLKRVTDRNSFSLWQDYHFVANVAGAWYGVSKFEDPDAESDAEDSHGDPVEFCFAYVRLDAPFSKATATHTRDAAELIAIIRGEVAA